MAPRRACRPCRWRSERAARRARPARRLRPGGGAARRLARGRRGRDRRPAGIQRGRQVHAQQQRQRHLPADRGQHPFRRRGHHRDRVGRHRRTRPDPCAGGAPRVPQPQRAREPGARQLPARARAAQRQPGARGGDLSAPGRALRAKGRHALRRRTADAGHRPRLDGRTAPADPGRALAGALAPPGRGDVQPHRAPEPRRAGDPAGRAERPQSLEIAGRAFVLENGAIAHQGVAADLVDDPGVKRAYLGI